MNINVTPTKLETIQPLRLLFLHEANFQFIANSYHARNWVDSYLISVDSTPVGYGSLRGMHNRDVRDTVFEFYVLSSFRKHAPLFFNELLTITKAAGIDCQSNDVLITQMLYTFGADINTDTILFKDFNTSELVCSDIIFRKRGPADKVFEHKVEPDGGYILDKDGEVVATGDFLLHYNMPYADLFMEVAEHQRHKGYGSFLIQELKKQCYLAGRVPAARCGLANTASKATLLKAGFTICGYKLNGRVKNGLTE